MPSRCWEVMASTGTPSCSAVTTPGEQVRRAGAGIAEHRGDLAGRLVEAFGHVHAGGLVADRHQSDAVRPRARPAAGRSRARAARTGTRCPPPAARGRTALPPVISVMTRSGLGFGVALPRLRAARVRAPALDERRQGDDAGLDDLAVGARDPPRNAISSVRSPYSTSRSKTTSGTLRVEQPSLGENPLRAHGERVVARADELHHRRGDAAAEPQSREARMVLVVRQRADSISRRTNSSTEPPREALLGRSASRIEIAQHRLEQRVEDLVAVGEEAVQRRRGHAGALGDRPRRGGVDALLAHDLPRRRRGSAARCAGCAPAPARVAPVPRSP